MTPTSEQKTKGLLGKGIEVADWASKVADAEVVHQGQDSAVEKGKQAWGWPCVCLAGIFSQGHISPPVETIFTVPMRTDEFHHFRSRNIAHG
jgi:hypothetical protein